MRGATGLRVSLHFKEQLALCKSRKERKEEKREVRKSSGQETRKRREGGRLGYKFNGRGGGGLLHLIWLARNLCSH